MTLRFNLLVNQASSKYEIQESVNLVIMDMNTDYRDKLVEIMTKICKNLEENS
jgi:hypothetical protein